MVGPSGPELVARLRDVIPPLIRREFEEMCETYADADGETSLCGALLAFCAPFNQMVAALDEEGIRGALALADQLLAESEGSGEMSGGGLHNSVLTCFLESVLPVPAAGFDLVMAALGPRARAHAERWSPYWLEPEPPQRFSAPPVVLSKDEYEQDAIVQRLRIAPDKFRRGDRVDD